MARGEIGQQLALELGQGTCAEESGRKGARLYMFCVVFL